MTFNNKATQKLIYGGQGIFVSTINPSHSESKDLVSPLVVSQFLINLNTTGYLIENMDVLFKLSVSDFESFQEEFLDLTSSFTVDGFIFRKSFAESLNLLPYSEEEMNAIVAQYAITYGWMDEFAFYFNNSPMTVLKSYFEKHRVAKTAVVHVSPKKITVSFDFNKTLEQIVKYILESKIVLREHQITLLNTCNLEILLNAYSQSNIVIKDIDVLVLKRIIAEQDIVDPIYFNDMDKIVRVLVGLYAYDKTEYKNNKKLVKYKNETNEQLNKTILKNLVLKIPTKVKKAITKAINNQKDVHKTVEKMFKYHSFWKVIFTSIRFDSVEGLKRKYPNFVVVKELLYKNDRSNTLLSKVEMAKFRGDYNTAIRELSKNPGMMVRNLLEYMRYETGTKKAKKVRVPKKVLTTEQEEGFSNTIDFSELLGLEKVLEKYDLGVETKSQKQPKGEIVIIDDAFDFIHSQDFVNTLAKTNTKLLWQLISLLGEENLLKERVQRHFNSTNTTINYCEDRPVIAIKESIKDKIKGQVLDAITSIKKEQNKKLGKVWFDEELKNYNVSFSGRKSNGLSLSGRYLTPGSKIHFEDILGQDKILRMGIAWRGESSCDLDHSINLLDGFADDVEGVVSSVYYGRPTLQKEDGVIITSSGDITSCEEVLFSTEIIDIDVDLAKKHGVGQAFSSIIQYHGKKLSEYEVFWFFNVIDKKDRILESQRVSIALDKMEYAIQVNEDAKTMLGFFLDFNKGYLEVLNIAGDKGRGLSNYSNAETNRVYFENVLKNRPQVLPLFDVLTNVFEVNQITKDINEANIVISSKDIVVVSDNNKVVINPNKDGERLGDIIF